uniref:Uncharacterized protein n=1 Tax=Candidatus Kentrum sp. LFY TaxID=2126342 RepID=A0A450U6C4_9GAMM|nr:MAG: hypothetical protein BECKLFY1418A_GA0070994_100140 [Candidatus Kentron sp. LFY]
MKKALPEHPLSFYPASVPSGHDDWYNALFIPLLTFASESSVTSSNFALPMPGHVSSDQSEASLVLERNMGISVIYHSREESFFPWVEMTRRFDVIPRGARGLVSIFLAVLSWQRSHRGLITPDNERGSEIRLAKLRLESTDHDLALVKQNRCSVELDSFAKLSGK